VEKKRDLQCGGMFFLRFLHLFVAPNILMDFDIDRGIHGNFPPRNCSLWDSLKSDLAFSPSSRIIKSHYLDSTAKWIRAYCTDNILRN